MQPQNPQADKAFIADVQFPTPPMYYINKYTDKIKAPAPPPVPNIDEICTMFGEQYNKDDHIIGSLESHGIRRLYPLAYDAKTELKKMNISVVVNFIDLLKIITKEPHNNLTVKLRDEKLDHISLIFYNMHHLINEFRPHQARDTLREIIKSQTCTVRLTNDTAQQYLNKATTLTSKLMTNLSDQFNNMKSVDTIMTECGLNNTMNVYPDSRKRKFEKLSDTEESRSSVTKIRKDCSIGSDTIQNFILAENVKDSMLWKQFFEEL